MSLQDVLNLDIGVVGEELGRGLRWWTAELAELTPARWRRPSRGARPLIDLSQPGAARLWRGGHFVELREAAGGRAHPADVGVAPALVLRREVVLPALGLEDLRRLAANDIDRLTPFSAEQVYFDLELGAKSEAGDRQAATLAVIRRADAEAAAERALRFGVTPRRLGVAEGGAAAFDFLPSMKVAGRGGRPDRAPLYWWLGVAACLAVNIGVLVAKDAYDVASLNNVVDLQQPSVDLAFKLRQRIETEAASRQALLARRAQDDPLRILDAVTRALPAPQSLQRLEFNGHAVRLVGFRDARLDVLAALQASGIMTRPRAASSDQTAASAGQPGFDVAADVVGSGASGGGTPGSNGPGNLGPGNLGPGNLGPGNLGPGSGGR